MLVARREERLRKLADKLNEEFGVQADVIVADLADPAAPQRIAATCAQNGWNIEWLINNAGIAGPDLLKPH